MVFLTHSKNVFQSVFEFLSSPFSTFRVITGLELHWIGERSLGTKEAKNDTNWRS